MEHFKLNERAVLLGYQGMEEYFQFRYALSFKAMAEELGVAYQTVSSAYEDYLERTSMKYGDAPPTTTNEGETFQ